MIRHLLISFTIVTLILGAGCGSTDSTVPANLGPSEQEAAFQQSVQRFFNSEGLPAVAAGLWQPGREPFLVLLGEADVEAGRAVTAQDRFRIGSVTKSFTVTVLLQLVDEGLVSLDDPIGDYLPTIHNPEATLEELANMTSGIFNYSEDPDFLDLFLNDLTRAWTEPELIQVAINNLPYFAPGADWRYSNTNTVALGMVIEQVTGNSLAQEMERRIFQPLQLSGTSYPSTVEIPFPFARGYGIMDPPQLEDMTASHPSSTAGSGALVTNLNDLAIWGRALGSGSLISEQLHARRLRLIPNNNCSNCPEYDGYGMGIGNLDGWIGHTGDFIGYQALVMYQPQTEQVAVILINLKNFTNRDHVPTNIFRDFIDSI